MYGRIRPDDQQADTLPWRLPKRLKRIIVKIGSGVLTHADGGLDEPAIEHLVSQLARIRQTGLEILVVSSGAIAAGIAKLALPEPLRSLPQKQAAAAIGQSQLVWTYEKYFGVHGLKVAQVLLTRDDLHHRRRYLNARTTLLTLLRYGVIPIINENDTVAVEEIKFGDNDTLAALVVNLVDAELLILLSHVDGLFTADPERDPQAQLIPVVPRVTAAIERLAAAGQSHQGSGGMASKVQAAKRTAAFGAPTVIANGKRPRVLEAILAHRPAGTLFWPRGGERMNSRKHWIAFTLVPKGKILVDDGAKDALVNRGRSLLPSGVVGVIGDFEFGDAVSCLDIQQLEFARGLVKYGAEDLDRIKGCHTSAIERVLGEKYYDEVIHRDDLVILL